MKATIVLIADNEAENYGRKMMMTTLSPEHISAIRFARYNAAVAEWEK